MRTLSQHLCHPVLSHPAPLHHYSAHPLTLGRTSFLTKLDPRTSHSHVFRERLQGASVGSLAPSGCSFLKLFSCSSPFGFVFKSLMCPVSPTRLQALWPQDFHLRLLFPPQHLTHSVLYTEMLNSTFASAHRVAGPVFRFIVI